MRAAVAELRARGLTAYDIAQAMGLSVRAVTDLLGTHKAGAT
jgi:predicted transcriptional regulator